LARKVRPAVAPGRGDRLAPTDAEPTAAAAVVDSPVSPDARGPAVAPVARAAGADRPSAPGAVAIPPADEALTDARRLRDSPQPHRVVPERPCSDFRWPLPEAAAPADERALVAAAARAAPVRSGDPRRATATSEVRRGRLRAARPDARAYSSAMPVPPAFRSARLAPVPRHQSAYRWGLASLAIRLLGQRSLPQVLVLPRLPVPRLARRVRRSWPEPRPPAPAPAQMARARQEAE
jgi:hypothetical protein